ncbi:hypothetical protein L1887_57320 [Cichorium endivia]|nr:hypothetical protein L1887_57320 [Cichorium endivia]
MKRGVMQCTTPQMSIAPLAPAERRRGRKPWTLEPAERERPTRRLPEPTSRLIFSSSRQSQSPLGSADTHTCILEPSSGLAIHHIIPPKSPAVHAVTIASAVSRKAIMSQQDGTPFAHHSLLSPPLLAAIDSQHVFGPYDSAQTPREPSQLESSSRPTHRRTRSRASSVASVHSLTTTNTNATTSQSSSQRRARRSHNAPGTHGRSGSNSISSTASGRAATLTALSPTDASRPLMASSRNRSIPNLDGLHSLSAAHEHGHAARPSAYTAPSSPLLSAAASLAFAMSPVAHASAMTEHVVPSDWALDASVPSTTHTALSRNASDYFDPALLAHLQSHDPSSHPELCASQPVPSPPPAHSAHAARSASQSEWAQHAAHMQQTAQLLGLQRLFASRSTPHLPDLDSSYLGHDFDSPPPYAPRAAAHETELERAADVDSNATSTPSRDPPLPPPISIPAGTPSRPASGPSSATVPARPPLSRARSSSRGSRSGPPIAFGVVLRPTWPHESVALPGGAGDDA